MRDIRTSLPRSRRTLFVATFLIIASLVPGGAQAAPLLRGFGGPAGYGSGILPANDDGSSMAIDLMAAFPGGLRFFGGPYNQFYVNNNGNITFSGPVFNYTPMPFPIAARPMIAPYWGDVDTRGRTGLAGPEENLVYWHLEPGRLVVTWYQVGYFASHTDLRMNFQMVITNALDCGSGDFDVEFRYDRCEWTTGDASGGMGGFGGTPAQAGFDAGNLTDFVALPGSFTGEIVNLCTTSNVGTPGVWQFAVRSGGVVCPDAGMPCTVEGATGPCAVGRTQCVGTAIECQPVTMPSPERCDLVDNDCDGMTDDGDDLCVVGQVCAYGSCQPGCFEGGCDPGYTCDAATSICLEDSCVGVDCPDGERCIAGACLDACEGIVCPHDQSCIAGECVDPCASVMCEDTQTCRDGICVPLCPCVPCPEGGTCGADGTCRERGCDIVMCPAGLYCDDGRCLDSCEGVVCPSGQRCELGRCNTIPTMPDAGPPPDAAGLDGGFVVPDAAVVDASLDVDASRRPPVDDSRGDCSCRAAGSSSSGALPFALFAALGLALVTRRRRR